MSALSELQQWYAAQIGSEWEHSNGIQIETLNKPGWSVSINLKGTLLRHKRFEAVNIVEPDNRWLRCQVIAYTFTGFCDPTSLDEVLTRFLNWAKSEPDWLAAPEISLEEQAADSGDLAFWMSLGNEVGPERCREQGCHHLHVVHSVLCRRHHFEMIRKKVCPFPPPSIGSVTSTNDAQITGIPIRERVIDASDPVNNAHLVWSNDIAESVVYELKLADIVEDELEQRAILIVAQDIWLNLMSGRTPKSFLQ